MDIDHPGAPPLTPAEQALLLQFRERLHQRVTSVGLTVDDIRHVVEEIRRHPATSRDLVKAVLDEAHRQLPGERLLTFDWD